MFSSFSGGAPGTTAAASASAFAVSATTATPTTSSFHHSFSSLGLGYTVAIVLGFLILLSTLLLAFYICYRAYFSPRNPNPNRQRDSSDGIVLPRIIFVAEDDDGEGDGMPPGLDPAVISSYPKFPYSRGGGGGDSACSICLCEYREGEMLRMMPDCRHYFHLLCVDAWLRLNASCPVCRNSPMPTPLSTPLSELVPLSQFPADRRRR